MRILIFSLAYYPGFIGGAEVAIKEIIDRIDPDEITFDIISVSNPSFFQKIFYPITAFFKAVRLHKKNKYDAVWSMMASYAGFAGLLFKLFRKDIRFILTIQEGENFGIRNILKLFFKPIFKKADRIQVISSFLGDWARSMGAVCPIILVPNGVDYNFFRTRKSHAELEILKRNLGKKIDDVFLITTGRLVEKNAVNNIIESLLFMPENIKLLIVGQGVLENELKNLATNLKLTDRVRFAGFIDHASLPSYLHISDIFVRPSLSEGFGISFIEAMAARIPVIATPVGGIPDFIKDGETGLFCEAGNPKSIAQKVEKLIKDKESRDYIINNAERMVKEKYDWNLIANDMKSKVFLQVL